MNNWKDDPYGMDDLDYINAWLDSDLFTEVCKDAENGDEDSEEVLDTIQFMMENLQFHLDNNTHRKRIDVELHNIKQYMKEWV